MIVTASKREGTREGNYARKELARLNAGYLSSHNSKETALPPVYMLILNKG